MTESKHPEDPLRDDPPSADEDAARLRLRFRHLSLVDLEEKGLVRWDRENHVVTKGPNFDEKRPEGDNQLRRN